MKKLRAADSERCFLVTDKSLYASGESLWFRAFLLHERSQKWSTESKSLFVDLVDEADRMVSRVLLNSGEQQSGGRIRIPDSLPAGAYWLRAYTKNMAARNATAAFVKPLYISNGTTNDANTSTTQAGKPAVLFFPEGGAVITGAPSTVGVRVQDKNGRPLQLSGLFKDSRDSVVSRFTTNRQGVGAFEFYPYRFRKYFAAINGGTYPFPPFNLRAAQLAVLNNGNGQRKLRVLLEDSIYTKAFTTFILGVSKDSLCFAASGTGNYEAAFSEAGFPAGPATLFLLDAIGNLLSERAVYIANPTVVAQLHTSKPLYGKREAVNLDISVTDASGRAVPATVTIAVSDSALIYGGSDEPSAGDAFRTNWFLAGADTLSPTDRDALLLTSSKLFQNPISPVPAASDDSLLYIKGNVLTASKTPAAQKIVMLFSKEGNVLFATDTTDAQGAFLFAVAGYPDSTQFVVRTTSLTGQGEDLTVTVQQPAFPQFATPPFFKTPLAITPAQAATFLKPHTDSTGHGNEWLRSVTVEGSRKKKSDGSKKGSGLFKVITAEQIKKGGYNSVGNVILSASGLHILNGYLVSGGFTDMNNVGATAEPLLVINGVEVSTASMASNSGLNEPGTTSPVLNYVNSLNVKDVETIEVLGGPEASMYGVRGGHGVIAIKTGVNNTYDAKTENIRQQTVYARGYHTAPDFTGPDYNQREAKTSKNADRRATLYWNENGLTDATGKLSVSFFTADVPGTYVVAVTGITARGDLIRKTLSFQVQ